MDPSFPLKVILFDLGSTLIYSKDPWPPIYEQADQALVEVLQQAGSRWRSRLSPANSRLFWIPTMPERGTSPIEKTTFSALQELLQQKGFQDIPASVVRAALDAMYSITQQNWYLETDAIPTLKTLREQGYRLGMISNTSDDRNVQQLVDRWELRPFFETIITSAGCGYPQAGRAHLPAGPGPFRSSSRNRLPWSAILPKRISWGRTRWVFTASGSHAGPDCRKKAN